MHLPWKLHRCSKMQGMAFLWGNSDPTIPEVSSMWDLLLCHKVRLQLAFGATSTLSLKNIRHESFDSTCLSSWTNTMYWPGGSRFVDRINSYKPTRDKALRFYTPDPMLSDKSTGPVWTMDSNCQTSPNTCCGLLHAMWCPDCILSAESLQWLHKAGDVVEGYRVKSNEMH